MSKKQDWFLYNFCLYRSFLYEVVSFTELSDDIERGYQAIKSTNNNYLVVIRDVLIIYLINLIILAISFFALTVILVVVTITFPISLYVFLAMSGFALIIGTGYVSLRLARFFYRLQRRLNISGEKIKF
ncbi:MAG: hypothetical protein WC473_00650 [Patescibacteria group bacterium]